MTSTNTDKYWKALIIGLVIFNLIALLGKCNRQGYNETLPPSKPAEQHLQREIKTDSIERAAFQKRDAYWKGRIKTDSIERIAAASKRKQAEQKAAQSANTYRETPTLDNCHAALKDCQEENETKAFSLAVQERMITEQDSLIGIQGSEINRLGTVADTLAEGWRLANQNNADLNKQLQKAKGKRFGIGVSAGYGATKHGLSPQVSVSINYNLIKF